MFTAILPEGRVCVTGIAPLRANEQAVAGLFLDQRPTGVRCLDPLGPRAAGSLALVYGTNGLLSMVSPEGQKMLLSQRINTNSASTSTIEQEQEQKQEQEQELSTCYMPLVQDDFFGIGYNDNDGGGLGAFETISHASGAAVQCVDIRMRQCGELLVASADECGVLCTYRVSLRYNNALDSSGVLIS